MVPHQYVPAVLVVKVRVDGLFWWMAASPASMMGFAPTLSSMQNHLYCNVVGLGNERTPFTGMDVSESVVSVEVRPMTTIPFPFRMALLLGVLPSWLGYDNKAETIGNIFLRYAFFCFTP